jgi:hypothetical protein
MLTRPPILGVNIIKWDVARVRLVYIFICLGDGNHNCTIVHQVYGFGVSLEERQSPT